ncbi:hypothetical protein GCM10022254_41180 [Actinomadura meridiana]|uniref:Uncharacterized protein n=1 Tax=Actinomadura meridiana TaxID=559626 RepID=A0ABP8C7H5_9ACTN
MTDYYLTDAELKHVKVLPQSGQTGMTREQWDLLSSESQRKLYYEYSAGAHPTKWDDKTNALPRAHEPERGKWDATAGKGYEVDPAELRKLARDMKYKLDMWKSKLNAVGTISITTSDFGDAQGAEAFVGVVNASKAGFHAYIVAIEGAYTGVIKKLMATADQYDEAHGKTKKQVDGVEPMTGKPSIG